MKTPSPPFQLLELARKLLSGFIVGFVLIATAAVVSAQDPNLDDFECASLGGNWTRFGGSIAEIVNGRDLGVPTNTWLFVAWTASAFDMDQFCEAVIADARPDTLLTQVYVGAPPTSRNEMKRTNLQRHTLFWLFCQVLFLALAFLRPSGARADCTVTNIGIPPLPDLGFGVYRNVIGGLYPGGSNARPVPHEAAGLQIATDEIMSRDTNGVASTNGRIVLLSIGMSNTTADWGQGFMPLANADPSKNPQLVLVDGAQGGEAATDWTNFTSITWTNVENRLRNAGVTTN